MIFLKKIEYRLLILISLILALNSYFFIERKSTNAFSLIFDNVKIHYLIYLACAMGLSWILYRFFKSKKISPILSLILFTLAPTEIVFILGLFITHTETKVHFIFYLLTGLYLVASALFFVETAQKFEKDERLSLKKITSWFKKQGLIAIFILTLALSVFGYFGIAKIENYAGVDEPLWTLDRIPIFWKNVGELDWKNTSISDKPGITVVAISGLGLLDNPVSYNKQSKNFQPQKDIRTINRDFRLPLVIFCLISLLIFYIFIQELLGKRNALLATIFISTSPMLIGMSRIINPDAILWVFVPLTILAYLIFLKKKTRFWLYLTGILLGLSLLTKYVANILYIFFFALIFLEYLFVWKNEHFSISKYLRESLINFISLTFVSLITFYLLFPETWVSLKKLFTGTILSQAFVSIAPVFIVIILFLFIDTAFFKNKISAHLFIFFHKNRRYLITSIIGAFLFFIIFILANTWLAMPFINFETILESPKSAYSSHSFISIFSTNFYPLIFTSLPVVLIGLFSAIAFFFKKSYKNNPKIKTISYFIFFILLYYLGTTFNAVVSTIRYQVVLYPLLFIICAIGINQLIKLFSPKKYLFFITTLFLLAIGFLTLLKNKPFFLGYASTLLPNKYIVDTKDMGDGSYEAAQYLNGLPNAKNIFVWTDKTGVCTFFIGKCDSFYDTDSFFKNKIDYFVVSSGRKNKFLGALSRKTELPYDFEKLYNSNNADFSIFIGNRKGNYIKVWEAENLKK